MKSVVKSLGKVYFTFFSNTGDVPATVNAIVHEVRHRYDFKTALQAESALRKMRQKPTESVAEFVIRAVPAARKALLNDDHDKPRLIQTIIEGMRQHAAAHFQWRDNPPADFRQLEDLARKYDKAMASEHGSGGLPVHAATADAGARSDQESETGAKKKRTRRKSKSKAVPVAAADAAALPAVIRSCRFCKGDHREVQCPRRPQQQQQQQQPRPAAVTATHSAPSRALPINTPGVVCERCGRPGHTAAVCWATMCFNCKGIGHRSFECTSANMAAIPTHVQEGGARATRAAPTRVPVAVAVADDDEADF